MNTITFDIECYPFLFCIQAKENNGKIHTYKATDYVDKTVVKRFLYSLYKFDWAVTFNGSHYDFPMLCWICGQPGKFVSVNEIAKVSKAYINEEKENRKRKLKKLPTTRNSVIYKVKTEDFRKNHFDVFVCYTIDQSKGLKHWELYRGWDIKESSVSFESETATPEQIEDCVKYCLSDVVCTERLFFEKDCQDEINARKWLIERCSCYCPIDSPIASISDRYVYGNTFITETKGVNDYINWEEFAELPEDLLTSFKFLANTRTPFEWHGVSFGLGGAHFSVKGKINEPVYIADVDSMYPNGLKNKIGFKTEQARTKYVQTIDRRLGMKRKKGTAEYIKAEDIGAKRALNSFYGKMRAKKSRAYAPNGAFALCLVGQMSIITVALRAIKGRFEDLVEINTDSFAVKGESIDRAKDVVKEGFNGYTFSGEFFPTSYWKDVNNYVVFNEDGTLKETHGDDSSDLKKKKNEPVVVRSLYRNVMNEEGEEPTLEESAEFLDYVVKFHKPSNAENCTIDGEQMKFNNYYFLWTTSNCPNAHKINFSSERIDKATGLVKMRIGVYAFSIEELKQYFDYVDRSQYLEDLKQLLFVWGRDDVVKDWARVATKAKGKARREAESKCKTFGELKALKESYYKGVQYFV